MSAGRDDSLGWRDRWLMALDWLEYLFRRLGCRILGHRWEGQYEAMGDASYLVAYYCLRCHQTEAPSHGGGDRR